MNEELFKNHPLILYEFLLLSPLTEIYTASKSSELSDFTKYSRLLIDKFAIHSSSFFHLSKGILEHKKSGEQIKMNGYDLFTVNTTFRAIMETYATFNHLFVSPQSREEKKFRFLLWKLDGLYQKRKYKIELDDFDGVEKVLSENEKEIDLIVKEVEDSQFISELKKEQLHKIFDSEKRISKWRFVIRNGNIKILQIIDLIKYTCRTRAFINMYKYSSIHTHSNFPAIEDFEKMRGKLLTKEKTDSLTRLAITLTCLMVYDISQINRNAALKLNSYPAGVRNFIEGMSLSVRSGKF
ncbi:hypothetical protein ACOKFD_07420 [Flagellimonas sp. S174]|uniref:hypothetical protein n=1 Tax=Flagellimonas sp. S174 TaxID=3410790 RepID=UPI003BF46DFE